MVMKKTLLSVLFTTIASTAFCVPQMAIFIRNKAKGVNLTEVKILAKAEGQSEWTTLYGGTNVGKSAESLITGYDEVKRFVFKAMASTEYQIRVTVEQGSNKINPEYWTGQLVNGSFFVLKQKNGQYFLEKKPYIISED
jgi:hypothetical protein